MTDAEVARIKQAAWRARHRDRHLAARRAWRAKNAERLRPLERERWHRRQAAKETPR